MSTPISLRLLVSGKDELSADLTESFAALNGIVDGAANKMSATMTAGFDKIDARLEGMTSTFSGQFAKMLTVSDAMLDRLGMIGAAGERAGEQVATGFQRAIETIERIKAIQNTNVVNNVVGVGGGAGNPPATATAASPAPGGKNPQQVAQEAEAAVGRLASTSSTAGHTIGSALNTAFTPLRAGVGFVRDLEQALVRVGFQIWSVQQTATTLWAMMERPWTGLLEAGDDARKFELSISGIVGGMANAKLVDDALLTRIGDIPLTLQQTRELTESIAKTGVFTSSFALATPEQAASKAAEYAQTVAGLSALNPQSKPEQIVEVLQQALEGQISTRQLRLKAQLDPQELAQIAGTTQKQLQADPEMLMQAVQKYVGIYGPGVGAGRGELASVSFAKLQDDLTIALQKVDESGVYDQIVSRFRSITSGILTYLNSPQFAGRAEEISHGLSGIFDGLGESGLRLIQTLSGAKSLADTPDAVASQIASIAKELGDWAKDLPGISASIGREVHTVAADLGELAGAIHSLVHPIETVKKLTGQDAEVVQQDRYQAIVGLMNQMGISGAVVNHSQLPRPEYEPGPMGGPPIKTSPNDVDYTGKPLWQGPLRVDTSGVQAGAQRLIAEQIFSALADADQSQLGNLDEAKWRLRQSIPNFDDRLSGALSSSSISGTYRLPPDLADRVGSLGKDQVEPNYAAKFHSFDLLADQISSWTGDADKLTAAFKTAGIKMAELSGGASGRDAFAQVRQWRDTTAAQLEATINALRAEQQRDPDHAREIGDRVSALQAALDRVLGGYQSEVETLGKEIVEKVGGFGVQIAQDVKRGGDVYAATVLELFAQGQTAIQQQAAALLAKHGLPSDVGLDAIPLSQRQGFIDELTKSRLGAVKTLGIAGVGFDQFSATGTRASAEDMARMGLNGPLPATDSVLSMLSGRESLGGQNVAIYQQALAQSQSNYTAAQGALAANPNSEAAQRAFVQAKAAVIEYEGELLKAQQGSNQFFASFVQFGDRVQGSMESSLGKGLADIILRTGTAKEALIGFARDVVNEFSQMSSRNIIQGIFGQANGQSGAGNGVGGLLGSLFSMGGSSGESDGSDYFNENGYTTQAGANAANGTGQSASGLIPLLVKGITSLFMADGGVVKGGPGQLALIGEGGPGADEAVIPLHGGSVPIGFSSSGMHAVLPGGRSVPAHAFATGGIIPGGIATGMGNRFSGVASSSGPASMGEHEPQPVHVTVNTQLDGKTIASHTYQYNKGQIHGALAQQLGPGGSGRRQLGRS